ncbi:hypothetical protein LTR53_012433 [Teratosphaeriaceae sp. CCFEE 6253]|nr:hypothetical protein LTR53_012433 [Teratosphaeriaceae sp. CCFEE 6253]
MEGEKASSAGDAVRLAEYEQRFWTPELALSDGTKEVLVRYSQVPEGRLQAHVEAIRAKAWAIHPYPCIGMGRFLNLAIGQHQLYRSEILPRMLSGEQTYLDLGCAFAQDVRRLVADGVDSSKCYGSDLRLDFIELGYELFNDRETLQSRFIAADVFDENSALRELNGQIDIIDASSFFHLFTLAEQKQIARSVVRLMRPRKDSLVVGRQVGNATPAEFPRRDGQGSRFRHDIDSWREMWDEVGDEAGVKFTVDGRMNAVASLGNKVNTTEAEADSAMMMEFWVRRMG